MSLPGTPELVASFVVSKHVSPAGVSEPLERHVVRSSTSVGDSTYSPSRAVSTSCRTPRIGVKGWEGCEEGGMRRIREEREEEGDERREGGRDEED